MHGIVYFRTVKNIFFENGKMTNRKLRHLGNLENLGIIIPSFRFRPIAKIKKSDFKNLEKRFPRFPRFPT